MNSVVIIGVATTYFLLGRNIGTSLSPLSAFMFRMTSFGHFWMNVVHNLATAVAGVCLRSISVFNNANGDTPF